METVEAIYANGVFRPVRPLMLKEGTKVRLQITGPEADPREAARLLAALAGNSRPTAGSDDAGRRHDEILYGPRSAR
jgi:predicted DNA-binding antitoxin AbrB/MazE fold protein